VVFGNPENFTDMGIFAVPYSEQSVPQSFPYGCGQCFGKDGSFPYGCGLCFGKEISLSSAALPEGEAALHLLWSPPVSASMRDYITSELSQILLFLSSRQDFRESSQRVASAAVHGIRRTSCSLRAVFPPRRCQKKPPGRECGLPEANTSITAGDVTLRPQAWAQVPVASNSTHLTPAPR
jgi:hypothetical protein